MKKLYFVFFFLFLAVGFAQESKLTGESDGFKLYPNPVTEGKVFITTNTQAPKKIHVYDVLGTKVIETTILREELNVSELDAGVYVLRVHFNNKMVTRKLIIK